MFEQQQNFGDAEDNFGLDEAPGSYGFMNAEDEGEGEFEDFEDFEGDSRNGHADPFAAADGFDQYDQFDPMDEGEGFDQYDQFGGGDFEGDGDEFLGKLWRAAKKVGRVVAPLAKKFAPQIGSLIGGALGGPAGAMLGGKLGGFAQQLEAEDEGETEDEMNAVAAVPPNEEQLAEAVAVAASKGRPVDAQSLGSQVTIFMGSRAPLPVKAVLPVLSQASGNIARTLVASRDPRARALVRVLPAIQKKTVATLTQKAKTGKPVTPRVAVRVMAKHAQRTMGNPQAITKALANNAAKKRALDKKAIAGAERFY